MLYPDTRETVPKHKKMEYNNRLYELLDLESGDEIFQAGVGYGFFTILKNSNIFGRAAA